VDGWMALMTKENDESFYRQRRRERKKEENTGILIKFEKIIYKLHKE
jgi:hypothetical protein